MTISAADVERSLETIGNRFSSILEPATQRVLNQAKSMVRQTKAQHIESRRQQRTARPIRPWGFSIAPHDPLVFRETKVNKLRLQVDLFMNAFWNAEPAREPYELTVTMRLWCLDPLVYFRDQWDAAILQDHILPAKGRVMLRIHFDLANQGQPGPRYHLQFGGVQHPGEFHWFPESLSVPRMPCMPLDLTLAVEMIAKTFHPVKYERLQREPSWKASRRISEKHLLSRYLADAMQAVKQGASVLDTLWNQ